MFDKMIENYRYAKENLNAVRFNYNYKILPILISVVLLEFIAFLILYLLGASINLFVGIIFLSIFFADVILGIVFNILVKKKEAVLESNKLETLFTEKLLEKPECNYILPKSEGLGIINVSLQEDYIKIDNLNYSYDGFDYALYTSNYCHQVNLLVVFKRNEKGNQEDGDANGVKAFSLPLDLNLLSIMQKKDLKFVNSDVLRFIRENIVIATRQILKYGKIQDDYDKIK